MAWSPNDGLLAVAYQTGVSPRDAETLGEFRFMETGAAAPSAAFSPGWMALASGTRDATRLWRVSDRTPLHTLPGHTGCLQSMVLAANGELLVPASWDGAMRL